MIYSYCVEANSLVNWVTYIILSQLTVIKIICSLYLIQMSLY